MTLLSKDVNRMGRDIVDLMDAKLVVKCQIVQCHKTISLPFPSLFFEAGTDYSSQVEPSLVDDELHR